ncbi:hypothetical protein AJ78_07351 [Emergomyces pasteurianus Ep9510]|uniref:Uncharacterized protein n=1 Tax=Emergomyces pasteurianus Ep9510 TaxID=1447872 RepID=A0A1J9P5L5_9EURO|nr:hypothetical protein AJ78_07351 [Emergomyces pasteurianus Ep9510]
MDRNTVNVPSDPKVKEADINRKLQLYGIYSAFKNGKVPSNKQIDIALNSILASDALSSPPADLSSDGHTLIKDVRDVIENAKRLILVKNQDNLIQDFIWDLEHIGGRTSTQTPGVLVDRESMKQDRARAAEGLQTLTALLTTNGQFRKLLRDATILMRDMASDAAQRAAGRIRPSEEEIAGIDEPAEENVWHDKPNLSADKLKSQVKSQVGQKKEKASKDAQDATVTANRAAREEGPPGGVDTRSGAAAGAQVAKERVSENVPEETKARGRELSERTKEFLREKMPQERRDQTIWRLKRMIVEIQGQSDYQQAIETLLSLAETYSGHGRGVSQQGATTTQGLLEENKHAMKRLQTILERFANSSSMDDLFDYIKDFYHAADEDPRLKDWFRSVDSFIRKCLREQGYVLEDSANEQWNRLYDEGQFLLRDRYRENTNLIVDEIKFFGDQFDQDPLNKAFGNSLQKLFHDLGYDSSGKIVFKDHLRKDITSIILPSLFERIRYLPLPRIEVSDPMADVVIENLVLESDNLLPNVVELSSDNYWRWGRKRIGSKHTNKVMVAATGIQTDWRDVSYYIKKKAGFPSITDTGVMDIIMGGEGFNFRISGSTSDSTDSLFRPEKISVNVNNLRIKIKKSNHKFLFTIFKPLLYGAVRPAVEKVLEKQIRDAFVRGDRFAYAVHNEAQRAWKAARSDPQESHAIYSYYVDAVRKQVMEMRKKADETKDAAKKRDTKVNLAVTERSSVFQHIKLPGGISSKATMYQDLAAQGEKWESPVFGIGDAAESTNLPRLAPITRKTHARPRDSGIGSIEEPSSRIDKNLGKRGIGGTQIPSGPHMVPEANIRV